MLKIKEPGKVVQFLGALGCSQRQPKLISYIHIEAHNHLHLQFQESYALFWPVKIQGCMWFIDVYTGKTLTYIKQK